MMNRRLFLCACLLSCGVFQASSSSPIVSTLGLPDSAKMRIGRGTVNSVDYSPDGKRIAASTIGVWIYDALYGGEIALLQGHTDSALSANYSPEGMRIVSAGKDGTIGICNAETGALLKTLTGDRDIAFTGGWGGVASASFSPDSKRILSESGGKGRDIGFIRPKVLGG